MAVAIDTANSKWAFSHSTVAFLTSPTVTPPNGSQLWVFTGWDTNGATIDISNSSTALTWNNVANPANTNSGGDARVWYANPPNGWSGTVTCTPQSLPQFAGSGLYVMVVTGAETTAGGTVATANGITGPPSLAITTIGTGSLVIAHATNWTGAAPQWTNTGANAANQTFLQDDFFSTFYQTTIWRRNGLVNAGTYTMDVGGTSGSGDFINVEIRDGAGGGPAARSNWGRVTI